MFDTPAASYDDAVTHSAGPPDIESDLDRARRLCFAADEGAAKDLLLSLMPRIEEADRDDLMLEVYAQLGELYLVRTAYEGVTECLTRIRECLQLYREVRTGHRPQAAGQVTMSATEIDHMICRYSRRALFLQTGMAAAHGEHESAATYLQALAEEPGTFDDLIGEHTYLITHARILCAVALCDDDLHVQSIPLWARVLEDIDGPGDGSEAGDTLRVLAGTGYGRFCVETGRLTEAEPWLRRAGARAQARGWDLYTARTQLERATAAWTAGDRARAQDLVHAAYPAIAEHARAHDVSRSWLYFGLISISVGELDDADERLGHAERHWRELGKPLHIHRILVQRSWVDILRGDHAAATERVDAARELLDSWPRRSWLQYARLDDHMGSILRADALADPGSAEEKFARAADLKVPAALAVDSVRYAIGDADARMRWATHVSARLLAGAFAVAWEWGNTALVSELIEYHCARGTFTVPQSPHTAAWENAAAATVPVDDADEYALVASGPEATVGGSLTRLGALPPLRMDPSADPILVRYRDLAHRRYGRLVTAAEAEWCTWP
ncbi:Predicted ATPase [Mycolicibacterium aurum]|uniref:Predicted ATPase n=1 Tax=Mycolicibacterium aurum TaxID=1791 RepID=A0A448ITZ6_MYCAU|nr:Predicted ATPase [Mycolicibacterium aurum]